MNQNQRPLFYEGQYLSADDLETSVDYERFQLARHELGAHVWGIGMGLDLRERVLPSGDVDISIVPGIAWDGYGRAIVMLSPVKVGLDKFVNYQSTTPSNGQLVKIWLRYDEMSGKGPAAGFEACTSGSQYARALENYAIEVGEPPRGAHGPVSVAGLSIDATKARNVFLPSLPDLFDESVPYQTFPESGSKPQWWIPVGYVRWKKSAGQPGKLVARDDSGSGGTEPDSDLIRAFRQYVGVVAESVYAADGAIRLRNRTDDPAKSNYQAPQIDPKNPAYNDLVSVEGAMRVFGDARLAGGLLEFRNADCVRDDVPQVVRRRANDQGGLDLQVAFASDATKDGDNAFSVGGVNVDATGKFNGLKKYVVVRDNGKVGINVEEPQARVQIDTMTTLAEGGAEIWSNFGSNAFFDGAWKQVKPIRPGVNLYFSSDGGGEEFRFLRIEANGANRRNIAAIGTQTSFIAESLLGIGNNSPATQVHIKTLTSIDEGVAADGTWANFGQNAYFDGVWKRIDNGKAGASLHINPDGTGQEFRFLKVEKDGTGLRNIGTIGTATSFIAEGLFGVGTNNPQARLDVDGRILRKGKAFSQTGDAVHNDVISLPWGDTDDWNIFVSPQIMGEEEADSEFDNALLMIECWAGALGDKSGFQVHARYKYKYSNEDDSGNGDWRNGHANYLLIPR